MRTITKTICFFDELTAAAKERAVENYRTGATPYRDAGEEMESIQALARHFNGKVASYEIDWIGGYSHSHMTFNMPEMERDEIGHRLESLGTYNKKTLRGHGDCELTGVSTDEDAIDGFRIAFMDGEWDLDALMKAAFDSLLKAAHSDAEYQFSMEGYAEHSAANDLEFYEDGRRFRATD